MPPSTSTIDRAVIVSSTSMVAKQKLTHHGPGPLVPIGGIPYGYIGLGFDGNNSLETHYPIPI